MRPKGTDVVAGVVTTDAVEVFRAGEARVVELRGMTVAAPVRKAAVATGAGIAAGTAVVIVEETTGEDRLVISGIVLGKIFRLPVSRRE